MATITVQFANKKERDKMWDFLLGQDLSLWQYSEGGTCSLSLGEHLGFGVRQGGMRIGFQDETMPQKIWALMAWMAVRSSFQREGWPVIFFEDEEIPVIVSDKIHDEDILFVDEDGILNSWIERDLPLGPQPDIQRKFLLSLSRRFEESQKKKKKS